MSLHEDEVTLVMTEAEVKKVQQREKAKERRKKL